MPATISAVIPTWNRADLLRSVLSNLRAQTRRPDEVIVVDNGSTDNTSSVARQFGATLVSLDTNRGFAVAVNEGITRAAGNWLLILNNDVVLELQWLERLLSAAENAQASFAVGKLLQGDGGGHLDGSWDLVSRGGYAWRCGYQRPDSPVWAASRPIALAPMTAALFARRVFEEVGLLETRFESYYEDVDFGIRCALRGFTGIYEPSACAVHLGKATFGRRAARVYFLSARNQLLLLAKHYPRPTLRRLAWPILVGQTLSLLAATRQGHPLAALHGKWQALRRWHSFRSQLPAASSVETAVTLSEKEILTIQRQIGFDIYWRLYFLLVRPR